MFDLADVLATNLLGADLTGSDLTGSDLTGSDLTGSSAEEVPVRLRERLVARAGAEHGLDVLYRVVDSPLGPLLLAATEAGLVRVAYAAQDHDAVLSDLADRIGSRILRTGSGLDEVARQLDAFFTGALVSVEVPLDLRLATGFRRQVLEHLRHIPAGQTETYAEVARGAGSPRAVRAVGTACATNPVPIVVPCHRVVRTDGSLGGYLGGAEAKAWLLAREAAA
ncbi:methylated-DNA--[protein]-cysteine S-methyltransferase [Intrasporangium calvum]|uniref:methylated-DNA--[protein]-cysteine S-methyltransferase n=1 Tax=Intrasporangium calvum TaxID=53358 RepID=UPI000DF62CFE|nr:methylated-DNA--[protein]-cysteine S-methyltransferase [Intrasporangium calvum]AXG14468.1 methylated-DNA--[protein]-cysteine S-methyltransferase [Intrasporangium calvum]